jgi:hypothetical protein
LEGMEGALAELELKLCQRFIGVKVRARTQVGRRAETPRLGVYFQLQS